MWKFVVVVLTGCALLAAYALVSTRDDTSQRVTEEVPPNVGRRLAAIRQDPPSKMVFVNNERRVADLRRQLAADTNPATAARLNLSLGEALLKLGESREAAETLQRSVSYFRASEPAWLAEPYEGRVFEADLRGRTKGTTLLGSIAVAYLRMGEQRNCQLRHTVDSCIFPIDGEGVHVDPEGSRAALEWLHLLLAEEPDNLNARWLVNVAHMTLGDYPEGVPEYLFIPADKFESGDQIGRFFDVGAATGAGLNSLAGSSIIDDFDNDGLLDIVASSWGFEDHLRYLHNVGDGTFADRSQTAGLQDQWSGLNIIQADYNNDGFTDVLILRGAWLGPEGNFPNSLLRNNGDGTFTDVTVQAGLYSENPTQTATWFDFDGDGWLDLFIGNEMRLSELYHNKGDGTFEELAAESGIIVDAFVKGAVSGDYDNDGRPDLYLSVMGGPNRLLRNTGPRDHHWSFEEVGEQAGVTDPHTSFATWFFDYDNDGWLDLFVTDISIAEVGDIAADYIGMATSSSRPRLYHNRRDGTFEEVGREMGLDRRLLPVGVNFADIDNDGWLDFYLGTGAPQYSVLVPNVMFRNRDGKHFDDVTIDGGVGHLQKGHGVSIADVDNDGDQDIYIVLGGASEGDTFMNALFANPGHGNHFIQLKVEGVASNRSAIGARLKLTVRDGEEIREIHRSISSGGSFGANPLLAEVGVGSAGKIEELEIGWPSGRVQKVKDLAVDSAYVIREGSAPIQQALRTFELPSESTGGHEHMHHHHHH